MVAALLDAGLAVRVLDDLSAHPAGWPTWLDARAERVLGDVRDLPDGVLEGVDAVSHQAAVVGLGVDLDDLPRYASVNELGTAVLLAAMARHRVHRLVLASSMVVYGEGRWTCSSHGDVRPAPRAEEALRAGAFDPGCPRCGRSLDAALVSESAPVDPRSVYAATKVAQEHLAAAWARAAGARVLALRYHNAYGPRMPRDTPYAGVAALWRSALERGEAPRVFEDGRQRRDFVHARDVARANLLAVQHLLADPGDPAPGALAALNVCSGTAVTVGEVAGLLAAGHGTVPVVTGDYRLGDVRHVVADPAEAERLLGFRAEVGPVEGLRDFAIAPLRQVVPPG